MPAYVPPHLRKRWAERNEACKRERERLMSAVPIYDGLTIFATAKIIRKKRRDAPNVEGGYIETILLSKVSFDGITIDHIWVKSNPSFDYLPLGTVISFRAKGYSYTRRDGRTSLGLRKIDKVQTLIKDMSPVYRPVMYKSGDSPIAISS